MTTRRNLFVRLVRFSSALVLVFLTAAAALAGGPRLHFRAEGGGPYFVEPDGVVQLGGSAMLRGDSVNEAKLRQIGLALHNYYAAYKMLPPAQWTDTFGTPLLSWRVLILPFLGNDREYQDLYDRFDLDKAWDDPVNLPLLDEMPDAYRDPRGRRLSIVTHYAGVAGPDQAFRGSNIVQFRDFLDGTSNTAMVGEVGRHVAIPWTAPDDVNVAQHPLLDDPAGFDGRVKHFTPFLFGDGSVQYLLDSNDAASVLALSTLAGSEIVDLDLSTYTLSFAWDLDGDGVYETESRFPSFSAAGRGEGRVFVRLRVTDIFGRVSRDRARIVVSFP